MQNPKSTTAVPNHPNSEFKKVVARLHCTLPISCVKCRRIGGNGAGQQHRGDRRGDPAWSPVSIARCRFPTSNAVESGGNGVGQQHRGDRSIGVTEASGDHTGSPLQTHRNLHICAKPQLHDSSSKSSQFRIQSSQANLSSLLRKHRRIPNSEFKKSRPSPLHVADFLRQMP